MITDSHPIVARSCGLAIPHRAHDTEFAVRSKIDSAGCVAGAEHGYADSEREQGRRRASGGFHFDRRS
jgi:hypothetical protein